MQIVFDNIELFLAVAIHVLLLSDSGSPFCGARQDAVLS